MKLTPRGAGSATLALALAALPAAALAQMPGINVMVDGRSVAFREAAPVIRGGQVMVPLRSVIDNMRNYALTWDAKKLTVRAAYGERSVALQIRNQFARVNNAQVRLEVAPFTLNGRTMVPLRFLSEALGAVVTWSPGDRMVAINTNGNVDTTAGAVARGDAGATRFYRDVDTSVPGSRIGRNSDVDRDSYMGRVGKDADYMRFLQMRNEQLFNTDRAAWDRDYRAYLQANASVLPQDRPLTNVEFNEFLRDRDFQMFLRDRRGWDRQYREFQRDFLGSRQR
jgi:hypothetical protein